LEVDNDAKDEDGSQQVGQVRQVLLVEGSLELSTAAGIDGGG